MNAKSLFPKYLYVFPKIEHINPKNSTGYIIEASETEMLKALKDNGDVFTLKECDKLTFVSSEDSEAIYLLNDDEKIKVFSTYSLVGSPKASVNDFNISFKE